MKDVFFLSPNLKPLAFEDCDIDNVINLGTGSYNYSQFRDKVGYVISVFSQTSVVPNQVNKFAIGLTAEYDSNQPFPETSRFIEVNKQGDVCAISYGYTSDDKFYDVRSIIRAGAIIDGRIVEFRMPVMLRPLRDSDENKVEICFMREFLIDFKVTDKNRLEKYILANASTKEAGRLIDCINDLKTLTDFLSKKIVTKTREFIENPASNHEKSIELMAELVEIKKEEFKFKPKKEKDIDNPEAELDDLTIQYDESLSANNPIKKIADILVGYGHSEVSITNQIVEQVGLKETATLCTPEGDLSYGVVFSPSSLTFEDLSDRQRMDLALAQFIKMFCKENLHTGEVIIRATKQQVSLALRLSQRNIKPFNSINDISHYLYDDSLLPF